MNALLTNCKLDHEYINDYHSVKDALTDHHKEPSSIITTAIVDYLDDGEEEREMAAVYTLRPSEYKTLTISKMVSE